MCVVYGECTLSAPGFSKYLQVSLYYEYFSIILTTLQLYIGYVAQNPIPVVDVRVIFYVILCSLYRHPTLLFRCVKVQWTFEYCLRYSF